MTVIAGTHPQFLDAASPLATFAWGMMPDLTDAIGRPLVVFDRAGAPVRESRGLRALLRREPGVADVLARYTTAEMAAALGVSAHTVRHHVEHLCRKAGVSGRGGLRVKTSDANPAARHGRDGPW